MKLEMELTVLLFHITVRLPLSSSKKAEGKFKKCDCLVRCPLLSPQIVRLQKKHL
jgi:hypothetical protein